MGFFLIKNDNIYKAKYLIMKINEIPINPRGSEFFSTGRVKTSGSKVVTQLWSHFARKVLAGSPYLAQDLRDWNLLRERGKSELVINDEKLQSLHSWCQANQAEAGVKFTHVKTWNDAFVWLQVLRQLKVNPRRILEVGSGVDPTLPLAVEAFGFRGDYYALDKDYRVKEPMETQIQKMVSFNFSLKVGDIFEFAIGRIKKFDLLIFNHFFDDLFVGMYLEEQADYREKEQHFKVPAVCMSNWAKAIALDKRTREYSQRILDLSVQLPDLLSPGELIVFREYISGASCKPGSLMVDRENYIRFLVAAVVDNLGRSSELRFRKINLKKIKGSPTSLFPNSFFAFAKQPE